MCTATPKRMELTSIIVDDGRSHGTAINVDYIFGTERLKHVRLQALGL